MPYSSLWTQIGEDRRYYENSCWTKRINIWRRYYWSEYVFGTLRLFEDNKTEYVARIYPPYDSDVPFVTGGVYFVEKMGALEYHVWSNVTYQSYYFGTAVSNVQPGEQYLFSKIQLAVENAINRYSDSSIPVIELSLQENPALSASTL